MSLRWFFSLKLLLQTIFLTQLVYCIQSTESVTISVAYLAPALPIVRVFGMVK